MFVFAGFQKKSATEKKHNLENAFRIQVLNLRSPNLVPTRSEPAQDWEIANTKDSPTDHIVSYNDKIILLFSVYKLAIIALLSNGCPLVIRTVLSSLIL